MRRFAIFIAFYFISGFALSQFVQVGAGNYLGVNGGPFQCSPNLSNYTSRFAYIYPRSVLGNLQHGDTVNSIEFMRTSGVGLNNSCNLKIYLSNTSRSDFGTGIIRWSNEISGLTPAYNQNPASDIGTAEGFHRIPLNNQIFVMDTTLGDNLVILVEFTQTATQSNVINWYFENSSTVPGYASNQMKSVTSINLSDSLSGANDFHPTLILNYPRFDRDIAVIKVYTLGKLPVPLGNPDSVKVLVRNVGKTAQTNVNIKTYLKGFNKDMDSVLFDIDLSETKFVNLPSLNPKKKGLDTVIAEINGDSYSGNNQGVSYRFNNENVYSYRDVTLSPSGGGIGFNGQTGDFVARFFSNKTKSINQVSVAFAITGRPFKIGIWDNSGSNGKPGTLLYLSDSLVTVGGNYILNFKKPVSINGTFYVGVRQLNTNNVAFGYQDEIPVRPATFFYTSPYGSTNWTDFHPDAPFKFLIEPRMQGDTDLVVISADFPKDSIDRHTTDTLAPKATIGNIGALDMKDSFDITCEIRFYGKLVYKDVLRDTMSSGQKRNYTFAKSFYPTNFGEHELMVYTKHPFDQIIDNDTMRRKFYVGVKKDVMVATVYDPPNNASYEYLRDTIFPTATVQNPGFDNSTVFTARCRILRGTTVLYNQSQLLSLPRFNSKIMSWPAYACKDTGRLKVVFTVEMASDVARNNDTMVRNVWVYKSYDLGVDSIALPAKDKFYTPKAVYKPLVRISNDGILEAYPTMVVCKINSPYSNLIYRDTILISVPGKDKYLAQFNRNFIPDKKGLYTVVMQVFYPEDRVKFNDSLKHTFHVGFPYDYTMKNVISPLLKDTLDVGAGPFAPKIQLGNQGYIKNADVPPMICQIWKNNVRVYQDIKSLNLDTGQEFALEFAKTFNPQNAGNYEILAFANYVSDVNRKNDTVRSKFYVVTGRDAYVESIAKPNSGQYFAKVDTIRVEARIANSGKLKMNPVRTYVEIYRQNQLAYFDKHDDSLNGYESKSIGWNSYFIPQDSGWHKLWVYTFSAQDQNMGNDTTTFWFYVDKASDVAIQEWTDPLPGSVIIHNSGNRQLGVLIQQLGSDTNKSLSGKVHFNIVAVSGGSVVFKDSSSFTGLNNKSPLGVLTPTYWDFTIPGFYIAKAYLQQVDLFADNDTLYTSFEVRLNGIASIKTVQDMVYPNPAASSIQFRKMQVTGKVTATDAIGRKHELHETTQGVFDVSTLSPGVYIVQTYSSSGAVVARFVKE